MRHKRKVWRPKINWRKLNLQYLKRRSRVCNLKYHSRTRAYLTIDSWIQIIRLINPFYQIWLQIRQIKITLPSWIECNQWASIKTWHISLTPYYQRTTLPLRSQPYNQARKTILTGTMSHNLCKIQIYKQQNCKISQEICNSTKVYQSFTTIMKRISCAMIGCRVIWTIKINH